MRFQKFIDACGEYRWRLRASNGEIICTSQGYVDKRDRDHSMKLVRGMRTFLAPIDNEDHLGREHK
jgi:uncharacterized protein YegP (UPF0339 family)